MAKTSFVLRALSVLGFEEILKLSEVLMEARVPLKKAAGEDLIVWNDAPKKKSIHQQDDAKILNFPKQGSLKEFEALRDPDIPDATEGQAPTLINSDLVLWQREITRESDDASKKLEAASGYQKSTQMYVVKSQTPEGKKKLRFASTDGILVNKKQA
ncbi:MAG TPA: hypothetical protein VNJ08_01960 [Bacteriovoracaceae bacterium]|nr:hypothetical protein [Bacteriovoracaceae bacterium]